MSFPTVLLGQKVPDPNEEKRSGMYDEQGRGRTVNGVEISADARMYVCADQLLVVRFL